jgi:hypothetical protein
MGMAISAARCYRQKQYLRLNNLADKTLSFEAHSGAIERGWNEPITKGSCAKNEADARIAHKIADSLRDATESPRCPTHFSTTRF